jgi:hypothetical protein
MIVGRKWLVLAGLALAAVGYWYFGESALAALLLPLFGGRRRKEKESEAAAETSAAVNAARHDVGEAKALHDRIRAIQDRPPSEFDDDAMLLDDLNRHHRN